MGCPSLRGDGCVGPEGIGVPWGGGFLIAMPITGGMFWGCGGVPGEMGHVCVWGGSSWLESFGGRGSLGPSGSLRWALWGCPHWCGAIWGRGPRALPLLAGVGGLHVPVSPRSPDILKPEVLLPKLDAAMAQVALPGCPKGPPSPGRSRRAKGRHRKGGSRGGCGEPGPEAGPPRGLPGPPSSTAGPDLLGGTLEAAGVPPAAEPDVGSGGAVGTQGSPPAQPPTAGDSERDSGAARGGRGGAGQHLTPAAMLYRAAVTRGQVSGWGGGRERGEG